MQEIINQRSTQQIGKGARKRVARPKPVRKPGRKTKDTPAIISDGLFALKLKVIPNPLPNFEKTFNDLHPAYLRFCNLINVEPKDCTDQYAILNMFDHLEQLLGQGRLLDIYDDEQEDKLFFVYLTPLGDSGSYGTIFYEPIANCLSGEKNKPYLTLFHKALRSLKSICVNDWNDFKDIVYDWMEERTEDAEYAEEPVGEDLRTCLDYMQDIYMNGQACEVLKMINAEEPLKERDVNFENNNLDPDHPICKYASELYTLLKNEKSLQHYAEEPDDRTEYYLTFPEQFAIYYDLDEMFLEHEEYINTLAQEGIQAPRLVTKITADMETAPMHDDSFPAEIIWFFEKHSDLKTKIEDYIKKGGEQCKM